MGITKELATIDVDLGFFQTGNINAAINIDGLFGQVITLTGNATKRVLACVGTNGIATPDDATAFINMAEEGYLSVLLDVLNKTITDKAAFAATDNFAPIILKDLETYNETNSAYIQSLILGTPLTLLPNATAISKNISMAFAKALLAYSD
ncbi:hypothetical protein B0H10DRAFT_2220248 [Mycena sp. CBHHK59/15]|nr:hypothetical protein B0H10DRAFT_2220248 [Mycena sp. CBHHK59/15]